NEGDYILYYYDTNGTPYFDSLLTNKATTLPCNQLLANKLDIGSIDDASVNIPVDSDGISNPEIYFIANFNPYGYPFGGLNLNTNDYFSSNIAQQYQPGAPFALEVFDDENHAIIPERIINIQSQGITHSLCLPETTYTDYMPNIYYYDTNGTPYADTFLTLPITEIPCNEIIGGPAPEITSPLTVNATVGSSFRYTITATNNPTNFRISNLPTGLSFDTSTGVIVGTASVVGTYAVEITALNSVGADTETLTITINPSINSYDRL
ncbi:MAG: Ig domain-containing protein, partial [Patescibacteria group bacterium]